MQVKLDKLIPRPEESLREFRAGLGQFATRITIITSCYRGFTMGMVANIFASVTIDPPLVLWFSNRAQELKLYQMLRLVHSEYLDCEI